MYEIEKNVFKYNKKRATAMYSQWIPTYIHAVTKINPLLQFDAFLNYVCNQI